MKIKLSHNGWFSLTIASLCVADMIKQGHTDALNMIGAIIFLADFFARLKNLSLLECDINFEINWDVNKSPESPNKEEDKSDSKPEIL